MAGRKCSVESCGRPATSLGKCNMHYSREKHARLRATTRCEVEGCKNGWHNERHRLCGTHLRRKRLYGSPTEVSAAAKKRGQGWIDHKGYRRVAAKIGGKWYPAKLQHRFEMEKKLGRKLLPNENVHHINGIRTDNRPENLELWVKSQPCGQRVQDLVAWAEEIIDRYGDEVKGLKRRKGPAPENKAIGRAPENKSFLG